MLTTGRVVLALFGVALLVAGSYTTVVGVDGSRTCGQTVLGADPATESGLDADDRRMEFENLTEPQQTVVRRAIEGGRPSVDGETWPWLERQPPVVRYQGRYYDFSAVTTECTLPPTLVVGAGLLGALTGVTALALAGREYVPGLEVSLER